jgi:hypothetical protein
MLRANQDLLNMVVLKYIIENKNLETKIEYSYFRRIMDPRGSSILGSSRILHLNPLKSLGRNP